MGGVRVSDVRRLPRESGSGNPTWQALQGLGLGWPDDVLEQFLFDHGREAHIKEQFGHLDLREIRWSLERIEAATLVAATTHERVGRRCGDLEEAARYFPLNGWPTFQGYMADDARNSWRDQGTWVRSPIVVDAQLLGRTGLHLVEGHTRLGALRGLVAVGVIAPDSTHAAWVGST